MSKKYKPLVDKLFFIIFTPCALLAVGLLTLGIFDPVVLWFIIPVDLFILYFLISPLFGYVELRRHTVFIKYGFFLKKEIPYKKIRAAELERSFISGSMMSLKNSFEHINIKYNAFDVTTVSVKDSNSELINELRALAAASHTE